MDTMETQVLDETEEDGDDHGMEAPTVMEDAEWEEYYAEDGSDFNWEKAHQEYVAKHGDMEEDYEQHEQEKDMEVDEWEENGKDEEDEEWAEGPAVEDKAGSWEAAGEDEADEEAPPEEVWEE
ncbi:hypothetical protein AK812_SmicGene47072, partial [Symbiodinium microadriaticum]